MSETEKTLTALIGNTPLIEIDRKSAAGDTRILAKLEYGNPAGSVKDRVALAMVEDAEARGTLVPGGVIIEPTSGNTGIGLALVAAIKGYRLVLTMPETMSVERRMLLAARGAELVLTPGAEGMKGAIARAEALRDATPGAVILGQFDNPANPSAHYRTTGPEIWRDTEGRVDIFVAGIGTGGTISGAGAFLKSKNPTVRIVGVEPAESPVLSGGAPGPHKIQGIGAGFVPKNFNPAVVDEILTVKGGDAMEAAREAARWGLLVGISSGAALWAAYELAARAENRKKTIVALLPDSGERYLSTELFSR